MRCFSRDFHNPWQRSASNARQATRTRIPKPHDMERRVTLQNHLTTRAGVLPGTTSDTPEGVSERGGSYGLGTRLRETAWTSRRDRGASIAVHVRIVIVGTGLLVRHATRPQPIRRVQSTSRRANQDDAEQPNTDPVAHGSTFGVDDETDCPAVKGPRKVAGLYAASALTRTRT